MSLKTSPNKTVLFRHRLFRGLMYILGFALFYSPLAFIQKGFSTLFSVAGRGDIHGDCLRMGVLSFFTGKGLNLLTVSGATFGLILVVAFFFGPQFCGKLCTSGGASEFLSRLVPKPLQRFQLKLQQVIPVAPIRYGILISFVVALSIGMSVLCAYCPFTSLEKLVQIGLNRDVSILTSTFIVTVVVWLVVLGLFFQGGRGFCSFLCPVGASQALAHRLGSLLPFTFKLKHQIAECSGCGSCAKACPMNALKVERRVLSYQLEDCIACHDCIKVCSKNALIYGTGRPGWASSPMNQETLVSKTPINP